MVIVTLVSIGDYPVAGNGANLLDTFQKHHPNVNNFAFDSSAPPPPIPSAPSGTSERPSTAPSSQPFHVSRARAEPKRARAPRRQGPPYKLPPKIWPTSSATSAALGEPNSPLRPPAPPFAASERAASISSASSRGFVDLLDAQWAIKPSDFRTRVQAAGARDYGEDVADRNMHGKGFDLRSPRDQEVYLRNTGTLPPGVGNDLGAGQAQLLNKRHSMGTGLRAASLSSDSYGIHLLKSSIEVSEQRWTSKQGSATSVTERTNRRNSLHSYVATTSSMLNSHEPLGCPKPQALDFSSSPAMLREKLRRLSELDLDDTTKEMLLGRPSSLLKGNKEDPAQQSDAQSLGPGQPHRRNMSEQSTTSWDEYPGTIERVSKRQTMHYVPSASRAKASSKRRGSLQNIEFHGQQDWIRPSHKLVAYHEIPASQPTKSSGESKPLPTHREDPGDTGRRARARSIPSISAKGVKPHDIEEMVPERNSSLRNYSLSSETATYSSLGSNSFRPHSRHTPTTSVDLTPTVPFFNFANSPQRATAASATGLSWKGQQPQSPVPSSPARSTKAHNQEPAPILTIDEYASSDDDSFEHSWRPRGENEKDLLFVETGYGLNGSQLPGLPGLLADGAGSRPATSHAAQRRLSAFYEPASDGSTDADDDDGDDSAAAGKVTITTFRPGPPLDRGRLSEPARPRWSVSEIGGADTAPAGSGGEGAVQDVSSDDEDIYFDIPRSRGATARHGKPATPTPTPTPSRPPVREEYELPINDLTTLIRQRKALKAKMREKGGGGVARLPTVPAAAANTADTTTLNTTTTVINAASPPRARDPRDASAAAGPPAGKRQSGYATYVE